MPDLIPSLKNTLFAPAFEISKDFLEIGLDSLLEDPILTEVPIVNTLASLCKVGYNLRERNLINQLIRFIYAFNNGTISPGDLEKHRLELDGNPKKAEQELSRILLILDSTIDIEQSEVLGRFYRAYINGLISWSLFFELSEANRRIFTCDYTLLQHIFIKDSLQLHASELYQTDRLISLGLVQRMRPDELVSAELAAALHYGKVLFLSPLGKSFCKLAEFSSSAPRQSIQ